VSQIPNTNEHTNPVSSVCDRSGVRTDQSTAKRFDEIAESVDLLQQVHRRPGWLHRNKEDSL